MTTPNWQELSRISLKECCEFRAEKFGGYVNQMWNEIVKDKDRDNEEIKSIWLRSCNGNQLMKREFLCFIIASREEDEYRPIDYKDVLRYFRRTSIQEENEARGLKVQHYKYD